MRILPYIVLSAFALFALPGSTCNREPDYLPRATRVLIFNQDADPYEVDGRVIGTWMSYPWYVQHARTLTLDITRDADTLARLIVTSLVDATDPGDFDACINLRCDGTDTLRLVEYSPCIDARLEGQ